MGTAAPVRRRYSSVSSESTLDTVPSRSAGPADAKRDPLGQDNGDDPILRLVRCEPLRERPLDEALVVRSIDLVCDDDALKGEDLFGGDEAGLLVGVADSH